MTGDRMFGKLWADFKTGFGGFRSANKGVSAVEFAFILPVMITLYIGALEFSQALTIDRRVTAISSATADLVAQAEAVDTDQIDDIFDAAISIMSPYDASTIEITVTSVVADKDNKTTVDWSASENATAHAKGAPFTLPAGLTTPFSSVIVAEVSYKYTPVVGRFLAEGITLRETFYLRPRRSNSVVNTDS